MLDHEILKSVAAQMMGVPTSGKTIEQPSSQRTENNSVTRFRPVGTGATRAGQAGNVSIEGKNWAMTRTGVHRLRMVRFAMGGREYQAIEQNAEKPRRWGKLAREGHKVVQFRDVNSGKYVAVVVDDKVTEYGRA